MTMRGTIEYPEEVGRGVIHVTSSEVGPAGAARLLLADGVTCWFDAADPSRLTDCWIDLEVGSDAVLSRLFGAAAPGLLRGGSGQPSAEFHVRDEEMPWVGPAGRLALLRRLQATPLGHVRPELWMLEAIVLRGGLVADGLEPEDWLSSDLAACLPYLEGLRPEEVEAGSMVQHALVVIFDRLDLFDPALDRLEHLASVAGGLSADVDELIRSLQVAPAPAGSTSMSSRPAAHDQLWQHLPARFFKRGFFASLALVTQHRDGLRSRLRISLPSPSGQSMDGPPLQALFARLINDNAAGESGPEVVAVDALLFEDGWYVTVLDEPPEFDDTTRVEIVADLDQPLLSAVEHTRARAEQWSILAGRAERRHRWDEAIWCWRQAENLYRGIGEGHLADVAAEQARTTEDRTPDPPFLAEVDDPDDDPEQR